MKRVPTININGVSETVGFIIIFGIVMMGIGLVALYGYPTLLQQQKEANIRNMEKTLIVLQTDLNNLVFKNVPYQETTVQVAGGTLSIQRDPPALPRFDIDIPGSGITQFRINNLRFTSDDGSTIISLENGAVVKHYTAIEGSVMISRPRWFYDSTTRTMVIPVITLNATENLLQTGIGTVAMRITDFKEYSYPIHPNEMNTKISYYNNVEDDHYRAWEQYFLMRDFPFQYETKNPIFHMTFNFGKDTVNLPVNTLVIKNYNITLLSI